MEGKDVRINYGNNKVILNNGVRMPLLGLGTYRARNSGDLHAAIDTALQVGYRLFDTAAVYGNEQIIGDALKHLLPKYGLRREDIFITTKLSPSDMGLEKAQTAIERSLNNLGMEYVDLFLIHFPGSSKVKSGDPINKTLRHESWQALINMYNAGMARAIGVSNFTVRHLRELSEISSIEPMVNQVEWHPYFFQPALLEYCKAHNIALQAYCSFGGLSAGDPSLMEEPIAKTLAQQYSITPAQVLLQWAVQSGVAVIPKSVTPRTIEINYHLNVKLNEADMLRINKLNRNHKYAWDPEIVA